MKAFKTLALICAMGAALPSLADTRPDHFEGKPSDTLAQALTNLSEYNERLQQVLARDSLSAAELNEVHQLTYTLENALEKIREEYAQLAEVLEEVHVASETNDPETVQARGRVYLKTARQIAPQQ